MLLRRLSSRDDRSSFSCGDPKLDAFFRSYAGQHQERRVSATYVVVEESHILGFVTVTAGTVTRNSLYGPFRTLPPFPLPVLLLARLGVASDVQRQGMGKLLLQHTLRLVREMSELVGCIGVIVDAKPTATGFYERLGFNRISAIEPIEGTRFFLPVAAVPPEVKK